MNSVRTGGVPIDHLRAEVGAFPFASESAFRLGGRLLELNPRLNDATRRLWRDAENSLLGSFSGFSVDEAVAIRDRVWFLRHSGQPAPLLDVLRLLASRCLSVKGRHAYPWCEPPRGNQNLSHIHSRLNWRWASFALPPDLLLAALSKGNQHPDGVSTVSPRVSAMLGKGYAEPHLHVGAGLDFGAYWLVALDGITQSGFEAESMKSAGAAFDEAREFPFWMLHAGIARALLGLFLVHGRPMNGFQDYLQVFSPQLTLTHGSTTAALLAFALISLQRGVSHPRSGTIADLKHLYKCLGGSQGHHRTDWRSEADFMSECFRYVDSAPDDRMFCEILWQYVRVRCLLYRHVTQRPMTPGLQWFIRFYARSGVLRRTLRTEDQIELAANLGGAGRGLKYIEVRTSPEDTFHEMTAKVVEVEKVSRRWRKTRGDGAPELGLVLHFIKDRGGGSLEGQPYAYAWGSHADPGPQFVAALAGNPSGYRFSDFYKSRRRGAVALERLLVSRPWSLEIIRGIDVCTDEIGVPNWVMAPLIHRVRKASEQASATLARDCRANVPPLRTTVHVGEDFVHLLSGLRNVDEAVRHLGIAEGDRIGHGLSLGVDAKEWARRAGRIAVPIETRLLDLVYAWRIGSQPGAADLSPWIPAIEHDLARLSKHVFTEVIPPLALMDAFDALFDWRTLHRLGFPNGPIPSKPPESQAVSLIDYLTSASIFNRGQITEWIDPSSEAELMDRLQKELRRRIATLGVTVEVNPTSNLLIGDLGNLEQHPLWRLNPPREESTDFPTVSICIGSDDPLTFASDLRNEYQLLADAMIATGLSTEQAQLWLNRVRRAGIESRFTLPLTLRRRPISKHFTHNEPAECILI